jgi:hypothetical protein
MIPKACSTATLARREPRKLIVPRLVSAYSGLRIVR